MDDEKKAKRGSYSSLASLTKTIVLGVVFVLIYKSQLAIRTEIDQGQMNKIILFGCYNCQEV